MPRLSFLAAALLLVLQGCAAAVPPAGAPASRTAESRVPVTILIGIDGFRADYLDRGVTPVLSALSREGVRGAMRPSFPSKTFPNFYTLVTGLRPDRHGIVANRMIDARRPDEVFTMRSFDRFWWDGAEPIWVAAERAGVRSAVMYWPGSNAQVRGVWPSAWQQFRHEMPEGNRVDAVIDWLRRPPATRPRLLALYFNTVDDAGHAHGPHAPETLAALTRVDAEIGRLRAELAALDQPANLVIVADHGMAAVDPNRVIDFARIPELARFRAFEDGPYASFHPPAGEAAAFEAALLRPRPHLRCWRKADIPPRLRYGTHPRVPPYLCLADPGWMIRARDPAADPVSSGGNHGWDPDAPEMHALFVAHGPAFRTRAALPLFDNVEVAPLLRRLIGLAPDPALDGSGAVFAPVLHD